MEKDYFKDRPESIKYNKNLYKGCIAFICLKKMQPFAKEISDLTLIEVTENLTKQYEHPRGQKVKGYLIKTDKYGNKIYEEEKEEVVGRCTYILDDNEWSLDTKDCKKFLIYNNRKNSIDILNYDLLKNFLKIYAVFELGKILFKVPICKYIYFNDIEKAENFLERLILEETQLLQNGTIVTKLNGILIYENNYELFVNNEKSTISELTNILGYNISFQELILKNYVLEKIL